MQSLPSTVPSRRRRFPLQPSVSRSLLIVAVLILVSVVGTVAVQLVQTRAFAIEDTRREMERLDMVFAEQTGRALETVDFLMRTMVESMPVQPDEAFEVATRRRIASVRQLSYLAIIDADGRLVMSTDPQPRAPVPEVALALLRQYAANPKAGLLVSEPVQLEDHSWIALMARRLPSADVQLRGISVAALNLKYFQEFYRAVQLDENGAIILHRRDGTVLARNPPNDQMVGSSYADLPPFRDILSHDIAGSVVMNSPLDGTDRILAIRALRAFPFAVNVSVDQAMMLAPWRRQALVLLGSVVLVGVLIGALLLVLAGRSRQVERLLTEQGEARAAAEKANEQLREQMAERERAEAALRQAQRIEAVGQLTGGVAHDFNNLLTVVLGNIDLLERESSLPPAVADSIRIMRSAAERGALLTGQLLAFARRQPLLPRGVDLNEVLSGMGDLLQSALGGTIRVTTALRPALWAAMVDPTQIELVILNLAINARDAMAAGGRLVIGTDNVRLPEPTRPEDPPAGDYVSISVRDTGDGMTPEVLARAFEPFFTTKPPGAGSGLGLSQVFGLARQSGGGVKLESTPGEGTTVTVFLPRAQATELVRPPDRPSTVPRASGARVLLVDDDDAVRGTAARLLDTLGYDVVQASGGRAALDIIRGDTGIDVLLTDVAMPEMSGADLGRLAQAVRPDLPVVFVSGYADPEALAGNDILRRMLRKPFRASELAAEIEAALAEQAAPAS